MIRKQLYRHVFHGNNDRFRGYVVDTDEHHAAARKLHAEVYLRKGFIYEQDVDSDGFITLAADPYQAHATQFVICRIQADGSEEVVATSRLIFSCKKGLADLPLLQQAKLYPDIAKSIANYDHKKSAEVSGLVKRQGVSMIATLLLYRLMWRYSLERGDELWLMACSPALFRRLKRLFGETVTQIGDPAHYTGEDVIPAMVEVQRGSEMLKKRAQTRHPWKRIINKELLAFFTDDDHFMVKHHE